MITVLILLLAFLVIVFVLGLGPSGSLERLERIYLIASPAPVVCAFVFPAIFVLLGMEVSAREWIQLISEVGISLSVGLAAVGVVMVWRKRVRSTTLDSRLLAGVLLASIPTLMLLLITLLLR